MTAIANELLAGDLDHVLDHTRSLWDELRGQRLFITGGTGFFGAWLLESFVWANRRLNLRAEACILTRDPARFAAKAPHLAAEPSLRFHQGDIQDFDFPEGAFPFVIHAATPVGVELNPLHLLDIIVSGTRRVLDFAASRRTSKFLLTSSGAVYGRQPPDLTNIPEDYAGGPQTMDAASAYGEGKRLAELLAAVYARQCGMEAKISRGFAFVGPHLPLEGNFAIGDFIRDALRGGPIVVRGNGTPYRSYLYAADLAIWLWTILFRGASCRPYNVGSDEEVSIERLACLVGQIVADVAVEVREKSVPGQMPHRYVPQVTRAEQELGLVARIPLRESIKRTVMFVRQRDDKIGELSLG